MANNQQQVETNCEKQDWEWQKFKSETSVSKKRTGSARIGVALIGLGRMGQIHLMNLLREPRANLLYCFDSNPKVLEHLSETMYFSDYGIKALTCDQFDVALKDPKVDAVVIATPHHFHEVYTRRALEASKNVMCEKPLTLSTDQVKPLFDLARKNKVFLMCAFNRRYSQDFRYIYKQIHENNAVGLIHMIKFSSRDSQTPSLAYMSVSGDVFHDSIIHDYDSTLWYLKQLPTTIHVMGKTWKEHFANEQDKYNKLSKDDKKLLEGIDDFFTSITSIRFPNGALAQFDHSREACYGFDQRHEIFGPKGMLLHDGKHSLNVTQHDDSFIKKSNMSYAFASCFSVAYENELRDILTYAEISKQHPELYDNREEIRKRVLEPPRPTLIMAALKIADAALQSAKTKLPVEIEWSDEFKKQFALEIQ